MQRASGFTLIEILVALVFIAIVGVSAQQRIGQFHDERGALRDRQQAHWLAWNQLMLQYQVAQNWYPINQDKPQTSGSEEQLGRPWFYLTQRQATVTEDFYRFETLVFDSPVRTAELNNSQHNSASLAMFLVVQ